MTTSRIAMWVCGYVIVLSAFVGWAVASQEREIAAGTRKKMDEGLAAVVGIFWPIVTAIFVCAVPYSIAKAATAWRYRARLPKATAKERT